MKLSISNIAWTKEYDEEMYEYIANCKFSGIEIAPTRIIEENPYYHLTEAKMIAEKIQLNYGLEISSMQSIWYGKTERIFENEEEKKELIKYTKQALDFAYVINCKNLVFGCPRNRNINSEEDYKIAIEFFREIGEYAKTKNAIFSIEANPIIYNTNFINTTKEAFDIVNAVNHDSIKVNLDLGTMIQNNETIDILNNHWNQINHIHISEPNLQIIQKRNLHRQLEKMLRDNNYQNYVSIEMKTQENMSEIKHTIQYVRGIFGEI